MKKNIYNSTHIEGRLYEHDLELKVTGEQSKNPGTEYIRGSVSLATDEAALNVVQVFFTYVTAQTAKKKLNPTYAILKEIVDGKLPCVVDVGADSAAKLSINSAIALNEFYTDPGTPQEELVSAKRNNGGFISKVPALNEHEGDRATFDTDMIITKTRRVDAVPERDLPEKMIVSGYIFDFRNAIMPVDYVVTNPVAMDYFETLDASPKSPTFTRVRGKQYSTTVTRRIEEEGAFGEPSIREVTSSRKEFVITWAQATPYDWDDESSITVQEIKEAMTVRNTYLADVRQRQLDYAAQKAAAPVTPKNTSGFDF